MIFNAENDTEVRVFPSGIRWYQYGVLHREGGPAIVYPEGSKCFYLKDVWHDEKDYWEEVSHYIRA